MAQLSQLLLFDTDPSGLDTLTYGFEKDGCSVMGTDEPAKARDLVHHAGLSLVVVTLRDPERTGLDLLRAITSNPRTRNVACVAIGHQDFRMAALGAGAFVFLSIPLFVRDILSACRLVAAASVPGSRPSPDTELTLGLNVLDGIYFLVRALAVSGRSAVVEVRRGVKRAELRFIDGTLASAELGPVQGLPALHQLLLWDDAELRFKFRNVVRRGTQLSMKSSEVIEECDRFLRDFAHEVRDLGVARTVYSTNGVHVQPSSTIPSEVVPVLRLFDGGQTLGQVLEDSPFRVFDTLKIIRRFLNDEAISLQSPLGAPPLEAIPPSGPAALDRWLQRQAPALGPEVGAVGGDAVGGEVVTTSGGAGSNGGAGPSHGAVQGGGQTPEAGALHRGDQAPRGGAVPRPGQAPEAGALHRGDQAPRGGAVPHAAQAPEAGALHRGDQAPRGGAVPRAGQGPEAGAVPHGAQAPRRGTVPRAGQGPEVGAVPHGAQAPRRGTVPRAGQGPEAGAVPRGDQAPRGVAVARAGQGSPARDPGLARATPSAAVPPEGGVGSRSSSPFVAVEEAQPAPDTAEAGQRKRIITRKDHDIPSVLESTQVGTPPPPALAPDVVAKSATLVARGEIRVASPAVGVAEIAPTPDGPSVFIDMDPLPPPVAMATFPPAPISALAALSPSVVVAPMTPPAPAPAPAPTGVTPPRIHTSTGGGANNSGRSPSNGFNDVEADFFDREADLYKRESIETFDDLDRTPGSRRPIGGPSRKP